MPCPRLSGPKSTLERHPEHVRAIGMITIELASLEKFLAGCRVRYWTSIRISGASCICVPDLA